MVRSDEQVNVLPERRFDASVPVPDGSSYDIARRLVSLADQMMYEAKRSFAGTEDPHIVQTNVRITDGKLVAI
jgi:hypothetical protein